MKFWSWFGTAVTIYSVVHSKAEETKCLSDSEVGIERHFWVNEFDLPFRIEVSSRTSHQLVSFILKILLKEVIGYPLVYLINQDAAEGDDPTTTLQKISSCKTFDNCSDVDAYGPELMINLEVWLKPGHSLKNWIATGEVDVIGPLGPTGRVGWYIAEHTAKDFWERNRTVVDHWRAFTYPNITKQFNITEEIAEQFTIGKKICTLKECGTDGIYRSKKCLQSGTECATLIADYPASIFEEIKYEIDHLGLLVNVAFVGDKLEEIVEKRTADGKHVLFFHRKPMALNSVTQFAHVTFPNCEDDESSKCGFEIYQLEKIIWSKIRTHAPHAFYVIQSIFFSQSEYLELLKSYMQLKSRGFQVDAIACRWVKNNIFLWDGWIPDDHRKKTTLYIGGIFPVTGLYWRQKSVIEAAYMAAEAINDRKDLLTNYHIEILSQDGQCAADEVMKSFISYVTNSTYSTMVGILGPACSDTVEPIAGVAKHFNSIIISYSAEGALFSNREKYPYFFRTIPENNQFRSVYLRLFQQLGFSRVAALTEDGQKYTEYISHLQDSMQELGMTFIVNRKFPRERENLNMSLYLKELKDKGAKIIIGDFYDYAARAVMCAAYELEMTASYGYVWFLPLWFTSNWYDTNSYNLFASEEFERVTCTTEQMIEAISGHLSMAYKFYADDDTVMQDGRNVSAWREDFKDRAIDHQDVDGSRYGGYTYDAVWVYATALDALFKENKSHVATLHTDKTSRRLMELIKETNFTGVTGPLFFLGSSRISDVVISQWFNYSYKQIGLYHPTSQNEGFLDLNESEIKWLTPGGIKPEDGTMEFSNCSVEMLRRFLHSSCEVAVIVANGLGLSVFILLICICGTVYKHRYDKKLKKKEKRWKELGLMENNGEFSLDEWEMPREHIVINRKLGEGAFGTVFGGEARLKDGGWVAVAVKTLKNGAKQEEKLNFLSEAEIMKQFDHINIVKLVGVCTTSEPVYTVMEFMLYGDLKTYLLSRRSIAAEKDRSNNDEVSDKRLTNMALDIARGLSYLASIKIVHRDLACRNCLVNISRSVKIADFGMCRAMFDSDYYRYNKKGMLPVRWMAPESLIDGLFTPMSDIWSYGVVLYEIVTFASVPYQGLSNNQVLERIKNFQILSAPQGIKPQLNALLLQCWSRSPQQRPPAAAIVETLANNPELISPSLDVPMSSVQVMDTGTFELALRDRTRGHSLSSIWQNRKNMVSSEQIENVMSDRPNLQSNAQENNGILKSGFKFSNKKTLHESFSRKKRDKALDLTPQTTYL